MTKRSLALVMVAILGAWAAPAYAQNRSSLETWEAQYENGIAAIVEGRIITREQLRKRMAPIVPQIMRESRSATEFNQQMEALEREVLQNEIDKVLIVKAFEDQEEMRIPPNILDNEFENTLIEEFDGDRSKLLEYLRGENKTLSEYRRELMEDIIVSVMRSQNRRSQSEVSPERIESFYNEHKIRFYQESNVHLRQIVLKPYADESLNVLKQRASRIIEEWESGVSFSELAREHSQDDKREDGGDWGWNKRSDLREEIANVVFSLEQGEVSEPFIFRNNLFIFYIEDKRDEGIQPLPEVRDTIERFIVGEIARENQQRWLERLRADGFVKYFL